MAAQTRTLPFGIRALTAGSEGPVVICLSGWPQTAEAYLPIFPQLSKNYQVLALDPPGLGESDAPADGDYSTSRISEIMHDSVTSAFPGQKFHLIGHDIGGWVAVTWAMRFPSDLLSLTAIDTSLPGLFPQIPFPIPKPANHKLFQISFNALPELPEILTEGRERKLVDWLLNSKATHPERITEEIRDVYATAYARPGAMTRGFAYYRALTDSSAQNMKLKAEIATMKVPIFWMGGRDGAGMLVKVSLAGLSESLEGEVIDDCGHYVMEEQPEVVAKTLEQWFAKI